MHELTPSQKGTVAEAAIALEAIRLGLVLLRPWGEGCRYDLVLDLEPRLLRVQCKLAREVDGALEINLHSNRCTPAGYVRTSYTSAEIDAVGVFAPSLRRCYLIPVAQAAGRRALRLRLDPARNGQRRAIRWACDYGFEEMIAVLRNPSCDAREPSG